MKDFVVDTDGWYCASCGEEMPRGTRLYFDEERPFPPYPGYLLHDEADGTAACGPVLQREAER